MTDVELGLVQQVDDPEPGSARGAGRRVYQFVTMRDTPVWLEVSWPGVEATTESEARRSVQTFVWRCRAGVRGDAEFEDRLLKSVADRLNGLSR